MVLAAFRQRRALTFVILRLTDTVGLLALLPETTHCGEDKDKKRIQSDGI